MENETSTPKPDKLSEMLVSWIWQIGSQAFIFILAIAAMTLFGFQFLTGGNALDPNVLAQSGLDWTNATEARVFLWSYAAFISVGILLGTYIVDDWKMSAIKTVCLVAYWLTASQMITEVVIAILASALVGILLGFALNRITWSTEPNPLARVAGRLAALSLAVTMMLIFTCTNEPPTIALWIAVPVSYCLMAIFCSGGIMKIYRKAQREIEQSEIAEGKNQEHQFA